MQVFSLLVVLSLFWIPLSHALELRGPYLTDLQSDQAMIVCHTSVDVDLALECWKEAGESSFIRNYSQKSTQHVFRLSNLRPETRYSYRIACPGEAGKNPDFLTGPQTFTTLAQQPPGFSFIAYGDSRDTSTHPKRHREVATHFLKHHPSFVVSTGDLLIGGQSASSSMFSHDWTFNFFRPLRGIVDTVPYYLTLGNHDQDSPDALEGIQTAFPNLKESFHYAFRYAHSQFIILHVANQLREFQSQKAWFIEELKKARDARWRIVFLHVSPFTNGKYRESSWTLDGREDFLETCVQHGVDLVMSGHDHSYQRFHPLRANDQDKHSVLFVVTALAGTNPYRARQDEYTAKVVNRTDHFCVVDVHPEKLTLTAYNNKNGAFDRVEVPRTGRDLGKVWRPTLQSDVTREEQ